MVLSSHEKELLKRLRQYGSANVTASYGTVTCWVESLGYRIYLPSTTAQDALEQMLEKVETNPFFKKV